MRPVKRHEGAVDGPLAQDAADQIGDAQRHQERVSGGAGAQRGGDQDVPGEAQQPRQDRGRPHQGAVAHDGGRRRNLLREARLRVGWTGVDGGRLHRPDGIQVPPGGASAARRALTR